MLRFYPLGGLGEIGRNCMLLDDGATALMLDCGVTFRERDFGVDAWHCDFEALPEVMDRLAGVVLTHGHEDHIGALPYLLRARRVPVYGPKYALLLAQERLREHGLLGDAQLHEVRPRERVRLGAFEVEPLRVAHSVVDATGLFVRGAAGTVLHTGDFKFDDDAPFGEAVDEARIAEVSRVDGIDVLLSDSTNSMVPGHTQGERSVEAELEQLVRSATQAVYVVMFASNVARMHALQGIAERCGRRVVLLGRSMRTHAELGERAGYLRWPSAQRIAAERLGEVLPSQVLGLLTGSQGEPRAAMAKLADGTLPGVKLCPGDRVILSSRVIPGHEPEVDALVDALLRQGAEVITTQQNPRVHASGHACQAEQQRMIECAEPRAFLPVHGGLMHMQTHQALAERLGVRSSVVLENGRSGELHDGVLREGDAFAAGVVRVFHGQRVPEEVVRERQRGAQHGVVVVVLAADARGALRAEPEVVLHGVVDEQRRPTLEALARRAVRQAVLAGAPFDSVTALENTAKFAARRAITAEIGGKPETVVRRVPFGH